MITTLREAERQANREAEREGERQVRLGARGRHVVYSKSFRYVWRAVCNCGWMSASAPTISEIEPRASLHVALAAESDAIAAERRASKPGSPVPHESLAMALESVGTCSCGDRTWRGYCHTCAIVAARRTRRATTSHAPEGFAA